MLEEAEKIEKLFISSAKESQKKIERIVAKLSKSIVNSAKKVEKDLTNEKKVMDSITNLVEKIEEVETAIKITKEVINDYSEGKNLSKEETKK
jgi:BMFP domain-containing protein YqiC